jgi:hypothetical protein
MRVMAPTSLSGSIAFTMNGVRVEVSDPARLPPEWFGAMMTAMARSSA